MNQEEERSGGPGAHKEGDRCGEEEEECGGGAGDRQCIIDDTGSPVAVVVAFDAADDKLCGC